MAHAVQPLPFKPSRLSGLSERLLASHYENNYGGAVRRLNAIEQRLAALDWDTAPVFEINGLEREALIAMNSMILHEVYFDGLGGTGGPSGDIAAAIARDFGPDRRTMPTPPAPGAVATAAMVSRSVAMSVRA